MSSPHPRVRVAAPADARALGEVHVRSWQATYRGQMPDAFLDALDTGHRSAFWKTSLEAQDPDGVTLVIEDDRIRGFASILRGHHGTGEIAAIYLDPESTGHGMGGTSSRLQPRLCTTSDAERRHSGCTPTTIAHAGSMNPPVGHSTAPRRPSRFGVSKCPTSGTHVRFDGAPRFASPTRHLSSSQAGWTHAELASDRLCSERATPKAKPQ